MTQEYNACLDWEQESLDFMYLTEEDAYDCLFGLGEPTELPAKADEFLDSVEEIGDLTLSIEEDCRDALFAMSAEQLEALLDSRALELAAAVKIQCAIRVFLAKRAAAARFQVSLAEQEAADALLFQQVDEFLVEFGDSDLPALSLSEFELQLIEEDCRDACRDALFPMSAEQVEALLDSSEPKDESSDDDESVAWPEADEAVDHFSCSSKRRRSFILLFQASAGRRVRIHDC